MAQGRPRATRAVFVATVPSRRPVRAERRGMLHHVNSRPDCPKGSRKTSGGGANHEFGTRSAMNPSPTQRSPALKETLLRVETAEFPPGSKHRTLLAARLAKTHLRG